MRLLNTELITSPYNWAIVVIIALFGLAALAIVSPQLDKDD